MQPIYVLPDAFTGDQTARFRNLAERAGFCATGTTYPPSYRNNDRVVLDDSDLAAELFEVIRRHIPDRVTTEDGTRWQLRGLNDRFRFCRYRDGQKFGIHRDGVFHCDHSTRSVLTFMIYLNDASEFEGGHTRFYNGADPASGLLLSMAPRRGTLIVFDHALWHDGAAVTGGTKYVMRSDVMYQRAAPNAARHDAHLGYVWDLAGLPDGRIASAGRDGSVRIWTTTADALRLDSVVGDHEGSVSAIAATPRGVLWTGTRGGLLRSFNGKREPTVHNLNAGAILRVAPFADETVAVATASGTVEIWGCDGRLDRFQAHRGWVWDLVALPGGALVTAGEDGRVRTWRPGGRRVATLADAGSAARCLALVDGSTIAAGCADGSLILVPPSGDASIVTAHAGAVRAIAQVAPDMLVTAGEDTRVHTWRLPDLGWLHTESHDDFVTALLPLGDGGVASAGYDGIIRLWPARASAVPRRASP